MIRRRFSSHRASDRAQHRRRRAPAPCAPRAGRWLAGIAGSRSGTSSLETAILVMPFFLMILGGIEVSRYTWTRIVLEQVAYAGARCAGLRAVSCSNAAADTRDPRSFDAAKTMAFVQGSASARMVALPQGEISIDATMTCNGNTDFVRIALDHAFASPFLSMAGLGSTRIAASACFPQQP